MSYKTEFIVDANPVLVQHRFKLPQEEKNELRADETVIAAKY